MIKMIGLDLDGTVLNDNKEISNRTKEAIQAAIKKGVMVLPATGRPLKGVPKELLDIEGIDYALSANGAAIYDLRHNKLLHEDCMDHQEVARLVEQLMEIDVMADVFIDGNGYVEEESLRYNLQFAPSEPVREYILATRKPVNDLLSFLKQSKRDVQKMTINFRRMEDGTLYAKEQVLKLLEDYNHMAIVSGIPTNLEITSKTATKGNGMLILGNLLGIKKEEIMACGDSGNDREMLLAVGMGVAMANSTADVLEIADYVTKSNEEDGVACAIEHFVLESHVG